MSLESNTVTEDDAEVPKSHDKHSPLFFITHSTGCNDDMDNNHFTIKPAEESNANASGAIVGVAALPLPPSMLRVPVQ